MLRAPQFIEYWVPSNLEVDWYCPTCRSRLRSRALHDPYCAGVVCDEGHRFQFPRRVVDASWCELASRLPSVGSTAIEPLLVAWMQRPEYRGRLQSQAAAALCRIHDFELLGDRVEWEPAPQATFRFCPQCRGELRRAPDQSDSHSLQIVCGQKHDYTLHGNLTFQLDGKPVEMDRELADVPLISLCRSFRSSDRLRAGVIHAELAAAFDAFALQHRDFWERSMKAHGFRIPS